MKRLALAALACVAACTSGGDAPPGTSPLDLARSCTSISVSQLVRIVDQLTDLFQNPRANQSSPFTIGFDYDFDGADDTTVAGTVTYPQDPAQPIPVGSDTVASFTLTGALTGSADLTLELAAQDQLSVTGTINIDDGDCSAEFAPNSIDVTFGSRIAAAIVGLTVSGSTTATVSTSGALLSGTVVIDPATQQATVNGTLNGQPTSFAYDIFPSQARLETLAECIRTQDFLFREIDSALRRLADLVRANDGVTNLPATPGLEVAAQPNPNVLDYRMQLAQFGDNLSEGTIAGQVRFSRLGFRFTVLVSWIVGSRSQSLGSISGKSDRFMEYAYDSGGFLDKHGAGSLTVTGCDGGFDVPVDAPITATTGTTEYRGVSGAGDTILARLVFALLDSSVQASVNGIPLPPGTLSIFPG